MPGLIPAYEYNIFISYRQKEHTDSIYLDLGFQRDLFIPKPGKLSKLI
jgi:hypothetical protein